jgi:hypothetical protein
MKATVTIKPVTITKNVEFVELEMTREEANTLCQLLQILHTQILYFTEYGELIEKLINAIKSL